jgi:DNA-binding transcriptional MerR regulator
MRIGELATKAGVNIQSVRFYERRRILREPARTPSGYRVYAQSDVEDIRFIRQCQELGFTLKEIQPLVKLHRAAAQSASKTIASKAIASKAAASGMRRPAEFRDIAQLARVKLDELNEKMRVLKSMRLRLLGMIDRLETVTTVGCPGAR